MDNMHNMESILISVKKMIGVADWDEYFDPDIIMHINTIFMVLNQLGVGPKKCFRIEDDLATWNDFITEDQDLDAVKTYMGLRVKLLFDPQANSTVVKSMNEAINELEWRLNSAVDY